MSIENIAPVVGQVVAGVTKAGGRVAEQVVNHGLQADEVVINGTRRVAKQPLTPAQKLVEYAKASYRKAIKGAEVTELETATVRDIATGRSMPVKLVEIKPSDPKRTVRISVQSPDGTKEYYRLSRDNALAGKGKFTAQRNYEGALSPSEDSVIEVVKNSARKRQVQAAKDADTAFQQDRTFEWLGTTTLPLKNGESVPVRFVEHTAKDGTKAVRVRADDSRLPYGHIADVTKPEEITVYNLHDGPKPDDLKQALQEQAAAVKLREEKKAAIQAAKDADTAFQQDRTFERLGTTTLPLKNGESVPVRFVEHTAKDGTKAVRVRADDSRLPYGHIADVTKPEEITVYNLHDGPKPDDLKQALQEQAAAVRAKYAK